MIIYLYFPDWADGAPFCSTLQAQCFCLPLPYNRFLSPRMLTQNVPRDNDFVTVENNHFNTQIQYVGSLDSMASRCLFHCYNSPDFRSWYPVLPLYYMLLLRLSTPLSYHKFSSLGSLSLESTWARSARHNVLVLLHILPVFCSTTFDIFG